MKSMKSRAEEHIAARMVRQPPSNDPNRPRGPAPESFPQRPPRRVIPASAPLHSLERAVIEDFATHTYALPLTLPLSSLHDPNAVTVAVIRHVLHKPFVKDPTLYVVDILSLKPQSDTIRQVVGRNTWTVAVVLTVRTARIASMGILFGIGMSSPYINTFRVTLSLESQCKIIKDNCKPKQDAEVEDEVDVDDEAVLESAVGPTVLCRCDGEELETCSKGYLHLVAVEPNVLKCFGGSREKHATKWRKVQQAPHTMEIRFEKERPSEPKILRRKEGSDVGVSVAARRGEDIHTNKESIDAAAHHAVGTVAVDRKRLRDSERPLQSAGKKTTFDDEDE